MSIVGFFKSEKDKARKVYEEAAYRLHKDAAAAGEDDLGAKFASVLWIKAMFAKNDAIFEPSWTAVAGILADRARAGDIVMTLGAGDIGMLGTEVLDRLRSRL